MSVFSQLQEASFRGVRFLVPDESKEAGKKVVFHEYPNSDRRFVEELGKLPPNFSITAIVHGETAIQQRLRLEQALEEKGRGILVHPVYGTLEVTAVNYTSGSTDVELGKFVFTISFSQTESNISLTSIGNTSNTISQLAQDASDSVDQGFISRYINPTFVDNIASMASQVLEITTGVNNNISKISQPSLNNLSSLNKTLNQFENVSSTGVRSGQLLIGQIRGIYNSIQSISDSPDRSLSFWNTFLDFGNTREYAAETTAKRIQLVRSQKAVDQHTRLNGLINSYESVGYSQFQTETELLSAQSSLESSYQVIVENAQRGDIAILPDVRNSVTRLRSAARDVLEKQRKNVWKIVTINPNLSSVALTTYRFYGNLDNLQAMLELNPDVNHSNFDETIKGISG